MEKTNWTSTAIRKLFRFEGQSAIQTLFNAEESGEIPKAHRISRGRIQVRQWAINQLPAIGSKFGFLHTPASQQVITIYSPKGGVLKTTFGFNLAKILALHGIKTLIIGLDTIQGSITDYALPVNLEAIQSLEELADDYIGLYPLFDEANPSTLDDIIKKTSLPTLDVIPETPELSHLDMKIRNSRRREYIFKEKLIPKLKEYQVILFDNNPGWSQLVENSLMASNIIITPMGCDIESFKAIDKNLSIMLAFQEEAQIQWDHFIQIPTLLERNKLSQQIYATYLSKYPDSIIPFPLRRSVKGQEARAFNGCVFEYEPTSELAQDYYDAITEIWERRICLRRE